MMEIIDALVGHETGDFDSAITRLIESESTYDEIIQATDTVEHGFLTVKDYRQRWHGAAYGKLTTNGEKKAYRERYGLKASTVKHWSATMEVFAKTADPGPFSHLTSATPLARLDMEKATVLLEKAEDNKWTAVELGNACTVEKQKIELVQRAERLIINREREGKKLTEKQALAKAEKIEHEVRARRTLSVKKRNYEKAKEVVEEYEKGAVAPTGTKWITGSEAKDALKILFKYAATAAHPDKGSGNSEAMVKVNESNDTLNAYIENLNF